MVETLLLKNTLLFNVLVYPLVWKSIENFLNIDKGRGGGRVVGDKGLNEGNWKKSLMLRN